MKITSEIVKKVADTARITLSDKEIEKFVPQFEEIMGLFSQLASIKETGSEYSIKTINQLRTDTEEECLSQEEVFSNTKNHEMGFFKGPKIK